VKPEAVLGAQRVEDAGQGKSQPMMEGLVLHKQCASHLRYGGRSMLQGAVRLIYRPEMDPE
jgi:hypothetical protein